jgi:AcrR family transcriptional regulator
MTRYWNMPASTKQRRSKTDPQRTRLNILAVARREFAEHGLSGGRVDAIAARMRTTKRMIYYYFGSKEGLYRAVLEQAYADIRNVELELDLDTVDPEEAIRRMISLTFDYEESHPDFIRLVAIENIHKGEHLAQSKILRTQNVTVIRTLADILARGRKLGVFREGVTATDLHMMISAFCFFRVSNRHTFGTLFDCDLTAAPVRNRHKKLITEAILRMLEAPRPSRRSGAASVRRRRASR